MSAARPVKITGPLTRVMKRNNGDSKVNIIFPPFFSSRLTCFALLLLPPWGTPLKRPPVVLLLDGAYKTPFFSFRLAVTSSRPVNALPETKCAAGYCFAEELERATKSHCWPPWRGWLMSKRDQGRQRGSLCVWFYWPPCGLSAARRPATLISLCRYTLQRHCWALWWFFRV